MLPALRNKLSNDEGILPQRLVTLSLKKLRKDVARAEGETAEGRDLGTLRPKSELSVFQSFFGNFKDCPKFPDKDCPKFLWAIFIRGNSCTEIRAFRRGSILFTSLHCSS